MTYKQIENLSEQEFKRLCGIKPKLFQEMVEVLKLELPKPMQKGGQPELSIEDQFNKRYNPYYVIIPTPSKRGLSTGQTSIIVSKISILTRNN